MTEKRDRSEERTLEQWEHWVDSIIVGAQERGEFDNLPGAGKPLKLDDSPFANGLEVGYGLMKNAGVAPLWVELDKEIRVLNESRESLLRRAAEVSAELNLKRATGAEHSSAASRSRWSWLFGNGTVAEGNDGEDARIGALVSELARLRREFVAQTEALNQKVSQFNASIPRDLWQLERVKTTPEEAVRAFDGACGGDYALQSGRVVPR